MSIGAIDTHTLIWYVEASPLLSTSARAALQGALAQGEPIFVSTVSLVEIAYLAEKGRRPAALFDRIIQLLGQAAMGLQATPFTVEMADKLRGISRAVVPHMPDRMIDRTRGSHRQLVHPTKRGTVTVSGHLVDAVHPKTLKSVLRQAGREDS